MRKYLFILFLGLFHVERSVTTSHSDNGTLLYDHTAYTECKISPEAPLYNGGIIKPQSHKRRHQFTIPINSTAFVMDNLTGNTIYSFSSWVKIKGASSGLVNATLYTDNTSLRCMGTVMAKKGCWSFLKGGFVLNSPLTKGLIRFEDSDGKQYNVTISGYSLQPFTEQQWYLSQQHSINRARKRAAILHVTDNNGKRLQGAKVVIEQVSREFPFGSAISKTIIGNSAYQEWFVERFNAAAFENELKWYETEINQGQLNYTIPDQMLEFTRRNKILVRGHNIFWENMWDNPEWVRNITDMAEFRSALNSRMRSLMSKYKNEFVHWDVNNEMLHYNFYEERLGANASLEFYLEAQTLDPLARLFMNDYNVLENSVDKNATVDAYVARLRELERGGVVMGGIGLQGHFSIPNPALIRAVLDKLATLNLPIWLTEVDNRENGNNIMQAKSLEVVLREAYSHPAVNGILLWAAMTPFGCYRMCLTDNNFKNLPTGDTVDSLLKEWQTGVLQGVTDDHDTFSFSGFFGDYRVSTSYGNVTINSTFSLSLGHESKHWNIVL